MEKSSRIQADRRLDAARALRSRRDEIIAEWARRVPSDHPLLIASVPRFLDELAASLELRPSSSRVAPPPPAPGFDLVRALEEYSTLREVIFETLDREGGMSGRERDLVLDHLQRGMLAAARASAGSADKPSGTDSEHRYRELFMSAPVGIAEVDPVRRRLIRVNPKYCEMLGYTEQELLSKTIEELTYPEDTPADLRDNEDLRIGARPRVHREKRYYHKNGAVIWVDISATLVRNGAGKPLFNIAVAEDITDRKNAEQALFDARERLNLALSSARVGIFEDNLDTGEVTWNQEEALIFGFPPERLKATLQEVIDRVLPEDRAGVDQALTRAIETGEDFRTEFRIRHPDGGIRWLVGMGRIIRGRNGAKLRLLGTNVDITERKQYEQRLYEAIQAREEVLAVVSHDLRNPLGAVMMSAQMLEHRFGDPRLPPDFVRQQARKITSSGHRMNRLIEDILDLSKMDAGRFSLSRKTHCGLGLVDEVAELMRPFAEDKGIAFEVERDGADFRISCDHDHLVRVFTNLIGNAIKFTAEYGTVRLGVRVVDGWVEFSVADTGPGIAEHHLPNIFDRYWQAQRTAHKGTGLGLAIAKGIVEGHGGSIRVESRFGKGTTFYFRIPCVDRGGARVCA